MREFLMLLRDYKINNLNLPIWLWSEKYDGMRCLWDGGVSRGADCSVIPWTNDKGPATGLWSRYGNVIHAPESFLDGLPPIVLDGELWLGYNKLQEVMSICRRDVPDTRWEGIRYLVFDSPSHDQVFTTGEINNPNFKKVIQNADCRAFVTSRGFTFTQGALAFEDTYKTYKSILAPYVRIIEQTPVGSTELEVILAEILEHGGEGIVLRHPYKPWCPKRVNHVLRLKPEYRGEGVVTGHNPGTGKYEGMLGSVQVSWGNVSFALSGFTDYERSHPESFPIGSSVRFKYLNLSEAGVPSKAVRL